jgi:hypothetical protein
LAEVAHRGLLRTREHDLVLALRRLGVVAGRANVGGALGLRNLAQHVGGGDSRLNPARETDDCQEGLAREDQILTRVGLVAEAQQQAGPGRVGHGGAANRTL